MLHTVSVMGRQLMINYFDKVIYRRSGSEGEPVRGTTRAALCLEPRRGRRPLRLISTELKVRNVNLCYFI